MHARLISFILPIQLLMSACCSLRQQAENPIVLFREKNPVESQKYLVLEPTGVLTIEMMYGMMSGLFSGVPETLKESFGSTEGMEEYSDKLKDLEIDRREARIKHLEQIQALVSEGGYLCEFVWSDGSTRETGFLVIMDGEVVYSDPWITDVLQ